MSVTYYKELFENEYLENIAKWHGESAWNLTAFKKAKNSKGVEANYSISHIGCPSYNDIITAIYGKPRSNNDDGYITIKKNIQKQLLECMFGNFAFPINLVKAAADNVSRPLSFTDDKGSFNEFGWRNTLEITCSLIKKYIVQQKKEEISMELEVLRDDRDYLYGRLLAVADKLEQVAFFKTGKSNQRATNAIRLMNGFSIKPFSTWGVLWSQLNPYINQLDSAGFYISIINDIMSLFKKGEYENNNPLSPLYLLGYSLQTRAFSAKNDSQ